MGWPGGHGMKYGAVWRAWHGKWYGLVGIAWYMYWPGEVWHGICYCLVGYGMVWPVGQDMKAVMKRNKA